MALTDTDIVGGVDTGLDDLGDADRRVTVRIDLTAATNSYPPT